MGTTLAAGVVEGTTFYYNWVGDTRIYLIRKGTPPWQGTGIYAVQDWNLVLLTEDDTLAWENYLMGKVSIEEIPRLKGRSALTASFHPYFSEAIPLRKTRSLELQEGDRVLICTDGVWECLKHTQMLNFLREENLKEGSMLMFMHLYKKGCADNFSFLVWEK